MSFARIEGKYYSRSEGVLCSSGAMCHVGRRALLAKE